MARHAADRPEPPPYAQLIASKRLAPPKMTITEAARRAGISDTRWSQLENGYRMTGGRAEPEIAPALTLAAMARAVGATAEELETCGRPDAAGELRQIAPRSVSQKALNEKIEQLEALWGEAMALLKDQRARDDNGANGDRNRRGA